jgi:hypothetical protein
MDGGLLDVARQRLPDVTLTRASMTSFDLGQRFDAVTCLFSSIGYTASIEGLRAATRAMAAHLNPGGILIVEPWILPGAWPQFAGQSHADVVQDGQMTLVRVRTNRHSGPMTDLLMHYAAACGGRITTASERHRLRMFTRSEYLDAAVAASLDPSWDDTGITGRGLLIATWPDTPAVQQPLTGGGRGRPLRAAGLGVHDDPDGADGAGAVRRARRGRRRVCGRMVTPRRVIGVEGPPCSGWRAA